MSLCPICNRKPMNCDCTPEMKQLWVSAEESHQESESRIAGLRSVIARLARENEELRRRVEDIRDSYKAEAGSEFGAAGSYFSKIVAAIERAIKPLPAVPEAKDNTPGRDSGKGE